MSLMTTILTVQVATALTSATGRPIETPERVTLAPLEGTTFERAGAPDGSNTYLARTPEAVVAVGLGLVSGQASSLSADAFGPGAAVEQVAGASAWGLKWPVWLQPQHGSLQWLFRRLPRSGSDRSRWVLYVVRDERGMVVVADSPSATKARHVALLVARSARWAPLERDQRLVGCFAHAESAETMCLRSDGSLVWADRQSKPAARDMCRALSDGLWATGGRTLILQRLDDRRSGRYRINRDLEFLGLRWARTPPCDGARDEPDSTTTHRQPEKSR